MALLIGEFYHLILNGRTVPGASPLDGPGKQWGTVQIFPDDLMGLFVGIRKPAGDLLSLQMCIRDRSYAYPKSCIQKILFSLKNSVFIVIIERICENF